MAVLYLYAITDCPGSHIAGPALEEGTTSSLTVQGITAVVSSLAATEARLTEANLWIHESVVEGLMEDHAVLPARFGVVFAGEAEVRAFLAANYDTFQAALAHVRGRVEVGVRILWEDDGARHLSHDEHPAYADGRAYLLARIEQMRRLEAWRQRGETLARTLHEHLIDLAIASTLQVLATPRLLLTAAYLVDRDSLVIFQQRVSFLSLQYPMLQFFCTGPWPAYNFVPVRDLKPGNFRQMSH